MSDFPDLPPDFYPEQQDAAVALLSNITSNDFSFFLSSPANVMHPPQLRHLGAAIDLTRVLLHNAQAKTSRELNSAEQEALNAATQQYETAILGRYPRHIDKGKSYYTHLTEEFVKAVTGLMVSGPNPPGASR